jgi:hypothetical protein
MKRGRPQRKTTDRKDPASTGQAGAARLWAAAVARPFLAALCGTTALVLLTLACFSRAYETNDDVSMNFIAAGVVFNTSPDEHLLFTNVAVGLALKALYTAAPRVPWYGGYLVLTTALAAAVTSYAFLRANPRGRQLLLAALYFGVVVVPCLLSLQFTRTAFLTSQAGLLLYLGGVGGRLAVPRWQGAAAALLVLFGSLIRFDAFLLACAVTAPLLLYAGLHAGRAGALRLAGWLAATTALCVGAWALDQAYYARSPGWEDFRTFNALRAEITDYGIRWDDRLRPTLEAVGWQVVDLVMIQEWFFADPERYSLPKVRAVAEAVQRASRTLKGGKLFAWPPFFAIDPEWLGVVLFGLCCVGAMEGGLLAKGVPAASAALACVMAGLLFQHFHLPPRVYLPLFTGMATAACLCSSGSFLPGDAAPPGPRALAVLRPALVLAAAVVLAVLTQARLVQNDQWRRRHVSAVSLMKQLRPRPESLYVVWAESFPYEDFVQPLGSVESLRPFRCLPLSALLATPLARRRLEEYGITDLNQALYRRPDVFLVGRPERNKLLADYVAAHYGDRLQFRVVLLHRGPPAVGVYQAAAVPRAGEGPRPP